LRLYGTSEVGYVGEELDLDVRNGRLLTASVVSSFSPPLDLNVLNGPPLTESVVSALPHPVDLNVQLLKICSGGGGPPRAPGGLPLRP
jgi:hypothetical protein